MPRTERWRWAVSEIRASAHGNAKTTEWFDRGEFEVPLNVLRHTMPRLISRIEPQRDGA